MDKSWIYLTNRLDPRYVAGAKAFANMTKGLVNERGMISCPCKKCNNLKDVLQTQVFDHIMTNSFVSTYNKWIFHGEDLNENPRPVSVVPDPTDQDDMTGLLNDIFRRVDEGDNVQGEGLSDDEGDIDAETTADEPWGDDVDSLFADMERELYPGCKDFTVFSFVVHLMHTKVHNKWTNASFDVLMKLMCKLFKDANLPPTYYKAKSYLRSLGLGYQSIHACKYDCALFWREYETLEKCPVCQTSRWVDENTSAKKVPHKALRYFPVTPRLKRMFSSKHTAADMTWHETKRVKTPGVLRHPADGEAWKHFDEMYPDFAADPRNVRLGLATDGFNPFGSMSNAYSMWPVMLFPYNMSPWNVMSDASFMMPLLIPGRNSPGRDLDVYLQPLIEELKTLWSVGVDTYDVVKRKKFRLRAAVLWTIHDFSAYGYVSGWTTSGYKACPTCNDDTSSVRITDKQAYGGHRRFLPTTHAWRKNKTFDGRIETRGPQNCFLEMTFVSS